MGREIRRVPVNWEHPKDSQGVYKRLSGNYVWHLDYYKKEVTEFVQHMTDVYTKGSTKIYDENFTDGVKAFKYLTEDDALQPPDIREYVPTGPWYQLYENVSEGTPLSPPFSTKKQLVKWLSENPDFWGHTWTPEQAESMVDKEYAMSGVFANGKFYTSEESTLL